MPNQIVKPCPKLMNCLAARRKLAELKDWRDQADVANAVYGHPPDDVVPSPPDPAKFKKLTDAELKEVGLTPGDLRMPLTNFGAAVYRRVDDGALVVGFRGTDGVSDGIIDLAQGASLPNPYYSRAQSIAGRMARALKEQGKPPPIFVGHSLGGGLASAAAWTTGAPATTFNAAGLSPMSKILGTRWATIFGSTGEVTAVSVKGEILTTGQRWTPAPEAYSTRDVNLDPPPDVGLERVKKMGPNPGFIDRTIAAALRAGDLHKMENVKKSLNRAIDAATRERNQLCDGFSPDGGVDHGTIRLG